MENPTTDGWLEDFLAAVAENAELEKNQRRSVASLVVRTQGNGRSEGKLPSPWFLLLNAIVQETKVSGKGTISEEDGDFAALPYKIKTNDLLVIKAALDSLGP